MKPPKKELDLSQIRVTRKSNTELHHADGHGWAVSYADLLMVLLSFFVLFFSLEEGGGDTQTQLQRIAMTIRGEKVEPLRTPQSEKAKAAALLGTLAKDLEVANVGVSHAGDRLIVDLGSTTYRPGNYEISRGLKEQIDLFFDKIKPAQDNLLVTVIGHTDDVPLRYRHELLKDNFDLSSLRALTVLKYLLSNGYPEHQISARAANSFDRNSRSISFELRLKPSTGDQDGS